MDEACSGLCWPNEHRCEDNRCVADGRQCSGDWDAGDDLESDESTESPWWHWEFAHTLQGLYLYVPLIVIIVVAVLAVCGYQWHAKRKEARNAKKNTRPFMECKSGPSLFPVPVDANRSVPRVRALAGAPPPVWSANIDIELQSLPPSTPSPPSTAPTSTPPLSCLQETTFAEEVTEDSQLLTKPT